MADINYDWGTEIGHEYDVGRADAAPVLVTHGEPKQGRLLLFLPRKGALHLREWLGTDVDNDGARWSPEIVVEPAGVVGDPTAAYARGATWVAYRMADRVMLRRIVPGGDHPRIGPAIAVPGGVGEPTLASFGGRLALLLWRSPDRPIGLRLIDVAGPEPRFGREEESDFASAVPVAAVAARDGETPALCVGLVEPKDPEPSVVDGGPALCPYDGRPLARVASGVGQRRSARPRWGHAVRRPRRASDVALVASRGGLRGARPALPLQRERDDRRSALVRPIHHDAGRCPRNRHRLVLASLSPAHRVQRVGARSVLVPRRYRLRRPRAR